MVAAGLQAWRNLRLRADHLSDTKLRNLGNWLILVPHPDDETLGAGALIAKLAAIKVPIWVVFLTDGSASHIGAPDWTPRRIAETRTREAEHALHALGIPTRQKFYLGWQDSHPHLRAEPAFEATLRCLAGFCREKNITAIATTWRDEGHSDHKAAYDIGAELQRKLYFHAVLFEYLVWGWTEAALLSDLRGFKIFALSDPGSTPSRKKALSCHRTQLSPIIANATQSFRLPDEMIQLAGRDPSILIQSRNRYAP